MSVSSSTNNTTNDTTQWLTGQRVVGSSTLNSILTTTIGASPALFLYTIPVCPGLWCFTGSLTFTATADASTLTSASIIITQPGVVPYTIYNYYDVALNDADTQVISYTAVLQIAPSTTFITTDLTVTYDSTDFPTISGDIGYYRIA